MKMDHSVHNRYSHCRPERTRRSSGSFLGTVLLIIGIFWLLKEAGNLGWDTAEYITNGVAEAFSVVAWVISFPVILLLAGIFLIAGRKSVGIILVVVSILFLLNNLIIPGIVVLLFSPLILIVLGVVILVKLL